MNANRNIMIAWIVAAALLVSGCASAPKPLQGDFSALTPDQSSQAASAGDRVRWGGEIVATEPQPDRTCFEVVGKPLRDNARPREDDLSAGRFLACRSGFYDPALFAPGRELTVTGVVEGFEQRPIGEYIHRYPRVAAEVLYLWPERDIVDYAHRRHFGPAWPYYHPTLWGGYWHPWRPLPRRPLAKQPDQE